MPDVQRDSRLADFSCPLCRAALEERDDGIQCSGCGQRYRFDQGIPDLRVSRFDYYFNPIPRDRMRTLAAGIDSKNWNESVREFVDLAPNRSWIDNIAVPSRYSWKLLMELPPGAKVLDIGCGLGALISSVAPHVGSAYATDLTIERLIFSGRRFQVFNEHDDIRIVASGDGPFLPFADQTFDAIFLSGVLEWVGEGDTSGFSEGGKFSRLFKMFAAHFGDTNPREIQLKFLKEVFRILKPEGELYVGIENRLNHEYFGRRRDHHSGLWFGSLMPRLAATLYSVAVSKQPYRTYTYGRRGYRRLFSEAGFKSIEMFGFNDGYSDLKSISPADAKVSRWQAKPLSKPSGRFSHHPDFVPAYGIFASKQGVHKSRLIDRLMEEIERESGDKVSISNFDVGKSDRALIRGGIGSRPVIVRLPMSSIAKTRELSNAATLGSLRAAMPTVCELVPEPLFSGDHQAQPYFVESCLPGDPQSGSVAGPGVRSIVHTARKVFEGAFWTDETGEFTDELFDRLVLPRVATLANVLPGSDVEHLISEGLRGLLDQLTFRKGAMHGDIGFSKMLFSGARLTGITDWHAGAVAGLPVLDAIGLAHSALKAERGEVAFADLLGLVAVGDDWKHSSAEPALNGFFDDSSLTSAQRKGLIYLYWLFSVTNDLPFGLQYDSVALEALIQPFVNGLQSESADAA